MTLFVLTSNLMLVTSMVPLELIGVAIDPAMTSVPAPVILSVPLPSKFTFDPAFAAMVRNIPLLTEMVSLSPSLAPPTVKVLLTVVLEAMVVVAAFPSCFKL